MACLAVTWWCYVRTASDTEPAKATVAMAGQRADQASSAHAAAAILPQGKILSRNEPLTFTLKNWLVDSFLNEGRMESKS
jgi:hypothetical protein